MALPNIINVAQIYGYSTGKVLSNTSQDIITNTSNQSMKVNTIMCANITATSQTVTVYYFESSTTSSFAIVYQVVVPGNSTLDVLVRPFYLKENDKITALAGANSNVHIVVSYETIA
jgi:hypothetical protein